MDGVIRVLVVDDHALMRQGIKTVLGKYNQIEVVGEASDGNQAVELARQLKPDVILMDLAMPKKSGLDAIREIKTILSEINVLVLSSFDEDAQVVSAIQAGALGYLSKEIVPEELVRAIEIVSQGNPYLSAQRSMQMLRSMHISETSHEDKPLLSAREKEVLELLAGGLSNNDIARQLSISDRTVGKHISNILSKLDLDNRTQAALYAQHNK